MERISCHALHFPQDTICLVQKITANAKNLDSTKLTILAIEDHWVDHGQRVEALAMAGLDVPGLVGRIENVLLPQSSEDESRDRDNADTTDSGVQAAIRS